MARIFTCMVPMRDGVELFTAVYLPDRGERFPVVLVRNLYRDRDRIPAAPPWLEDGLCFVEQDVRGAGRSGGEWYPWFNEAEDGEDMLRWILAQPWCDGGIAMTGGSYLGAVQWFAAASGVPGLVGISPWVAPCDYWNSPKYQGGAFILKQNISWALGNWRKNARPELPEFDAEALCRRLPLREIDAAAGLGEVSFWRDWFDHPAYDGYWEKYDLHTFVGQIRAPAFILSGWFDIYTQGALDSFTLMRSRSATPAARRFTRCVIGPWDHGTNTGDLDCGPDCSRDRYGTEPARRFLTNLLLDPDSDPLPEEPALRYFMLGSNEWRSADCWPVPGMEARPFYLHSRGAANTLRGDGRLSELPPEAEPSDSYCYDPEHPAPTAGGHGIGGVVNSSHDQTMVEERADVLVYTSEALDRKLEIAGPVTVILYASSSAPDTDFTAKLVDVHPDGRAFNLADGILRARYRRSRREPELLEPGRVERFEIDLWSVANAFLPGHRVRLEISSSNFPEFDRNANSGLPIGEDTVLHVAAQRVFHSGEYRSQLLLPVLPEGNGG